MAGYLILGTFRKGPPDMSHMDRDVAELKAGAEKMGARIVGMWGLMGRHDMFMVIDAPTEMAAVGVASAVGKALDVATETMRAFSEEELADMGRQMAG